MYFPLNLTAAILSFLLSSIYKKKKNIKVKITFLIVGLLFAILSLLDIYAVYHERDYPGVEIMSFKDMVKMLFLSGF